jgi:hypothetical protein
MAVAGLEAGMALLLLPCPGSNAKVLPVGLERRRMDRLRCLKAGLAERKLSWFLRFSSG